MSRSIDVEVNVKNAAAIGAFAGMGAAIAQVGIQLATAAIDAGIEAIGNSIELASDKAEAASKVNVIYGESADAIAKASENAATTVGLSSGAYLTAAGNLGNLLKNFDLSVSAASDMSQGMIQLAADVGSFNNADPSEVIEAMGAALRGESEPMRRFGVLIDEAAIKAKAMELGLADASGAVDRAGRAQAIYALMLEQTADAQGDFARTSDGLANQQRINAARMEDAWTRVGEKLMPLVNAVLPMLADAIVGIVDTIDQILGAIGDWIQDNQELVDTLSDIADTIFSALQTAFGWFIDIVGELAYRIGGLIGLFIDLAGAVIDLGAAIAAVLRGDFEAAGNHAQLALERIQGFQENVQRAIGDTARRAADEAEIAARETAQAMVEASDESEARTQAAWQRSAQMASQGADGIARSATSGVAQGLGAGVGAVDAQASRLGQTIPDGINEGRKDAVDIAAQTPGELASALRNKRAAWQDALDTLGDDLKNAMSEAQERAELEAALTGKRLARGLNSADPIVRAQAEQTRDLILNRLDELKGGAAGAAEGFIDRFVAATRAGKSRITAAINYSFGSQMRGQSPPAEGPLHFVGDWADAVFGYYMERAERALRRGFGGVTDALIPRGLSIESVGNSRGGGLGGGGITVNVYAGVGDPVAIGREVNDALEAYYRASGRGA